MYHFFWLIGFFLVHALFSQVHAADINQQLDELDLKLTTSVSDAKQLISDLNEVGDQLSSEQQARLLVGESVVSLLENRQQDALTSLAEAEKYTNTTGMLTKVYSYRTVAYLSLKRYADALDTLSMSLARVETLDDVDIKVDAYIRASNSFLELGALNETILYAQRAQSALSAQDQRHCNLYLMVAAANLRLDNIDAAENNFSSAESHCSKVNRPMIATMAQKGLAEVQLSRENYLAAISRLEKALAGYQTFNYVAEINHVYSLLAKSYLALGEHDKALFYVNKVTDSALEPRNLEFMKVSAKVKAELAYREEDYRQAYDNIVLFQQISVQELDVAQAKEQAYQMAKFENNEMSRQLRMLEQDRELYNARQELKALEDSRNSMILLVTLGGMVLVSIFGVTTLVQKQRYKKLAQFDPLTGAYNRGIGQELAENLFVKTVAYHKPFSVIILDLDNFKSINDSYGHHAGDWSLKQVAKVVRKCISGQDMLVRMGGEEFAIFLPNRDKQTAQQLAELCREGIAAIEGKYNNYTFDITASLGVTSNLESDLSLDPITHRADLAMYRAKNQGRNNVVFQLDNSGESTADAYQSKFALG
ncbi:diguanylate cyclase [Shewanella waksmanii]|uniref:GGDEF domain-containing protein n=1 Tax=Shewanella waksmanii TaxID=213783 RepID=UPI003736F25A